MQFWILELEKHSQNFTFAKINSPIPTRKIIEKLCYVYVYTQSLYL